MPDSSWDTYTPERPSVLGRFGGRLLVALGVAGVAVTMLVVGFASAARSQRGSAWVLARNVEAQLRTDERARELFRRNPALARAYADEEAFLARVREHRAGLGLPEREPPEGPEYRIGTGPFRLWVQVKCTGGTWIDVVVQSAEPFGSPPPGDGITRVVLARERTELRQQFRAQAERRNSAPWKRFRALAEELVRDGSGPLATRHPGLRTFPSDPAAFAAAVQRRREALVALPAERRQDGSSRIHSRTSPFKQQLDIEADLKDGGLLRARWERDALVEVELR